MTAERKLRIVRTGGGNELVDIPGGPMGVAVGDEVRLVSSHARLLVEGGEFRYVPRRPTGQSEPGEPSDNEDDADDSDDEDEAPAPVEDDEPTEDED